MMVTSELERVTKQVDLVIIHKNSIRSYSEWEHYIIISSKSFILSPSQHAYVFYMCLLHLVV